MLSKGTSPPQMLMLLSVYDVTKSDLEFEIAECL